MKSLVAGRGQIGGAVIGLLKDGYHDVSTVDIQGGYNNKPYKIDLLHICFPYSDDFIKAVQGYVELHNPEHIVVWSTVAIGTVEQIPKAVHSPVEGKHPQLLESIRQARRWIGYNNRREARFWSEFFNDMGIETVPVKHSRATEALKLLSTTKYGINLVFADFVMSVLDDIGIDFELSKQWDRDYNNLYKKLGLYRFQKFVLDAPEGKIGGHCVRQNTELLKEQYDDELLDLILEMRGE